MLKNSKLINTSRGNMDQMQDLDLDKFYADTGLTPHMEDYLETISILATTNKVVRVKDIAQRLEIKMPSVTAALNKLRDMEMIDYEKYGFIELTIMGQTVADMVIHRHECLSDFFRNFLQMPKLNAENVACKIEHHVSIETCKQIHKLLEFYSKEKNENNEWIQRLQKHLKI